MYFLEVLSLFRANDATADSLDSDRKKIGTMGAVALANALQQITRLTTLYLWRNFIIDAHIKQQQRSEISAPECARIDAPGGTACHGVSVSN